MLRWTRCPETKGLQRTKCSRWPDPDTGRCKFILVFFSEEDLPEDPRHSQLKSNVGEARLEGSNAGSLSYTASVWSIRFAPFLRRILIEHSLQLLASQATGSILWRTVESKVIQGSQKWPSISLSENRVADSHEV